MGFSVKSWSERVRVEGGLSLLEDERGLIRLGGGRWRKIEHLLRGRPPLEAVQLTQQISGDSGVSHALAALRACEQAMEIKPLEQGLLLRELLYGLSQLHGHVRHFYFQVLPDYLPARALKSYRGKNIALLKAAKLYTSAAGQDKKFTSGFSYLEHQKLLEHQYDSLNGLANLQRMLAVLGGKFPMVMSLAPGGLTTKIDDHSLLRIKRLFNNLPPLVETQLTPDIALLLNKHPLLKIQGQSPIAFLSLGSENATVELNADPFAAGILTNSKLQPLPLNFIEDISHSFYRLSRPKHILKPDPQKTTAYSWIKAPRNQNQPLQVGPLARLAVSNLTSHNLPRGTLLNEFQTLFQKPPHQINNVAARLLACSIESRILLQHIQNLILQIKPNQKTSVSYLPSLKHQQAWGHAEAPAGSISHHLVLKNGRIHHYNIIAPSTWNGSPLDDKKLAGPLESALNHRNTRPDLTPLTANRIINSFGFSSSDAIH